MRAAPRHWYAVTPLTLALLPLAWLFGAVAALRRWCYRSGLLRRVRLPVPVIVIGNLLVGGTGKTPLVLWTAAWLRRRGYRPGILLRGYKAGGAQAREVAAGDDAAAVGDEALLLAANSGCPVWIGADRAAAGTALLRRHPDCDILLCDDGLQHYRLARDLEIAVQDERGHGNGLLLPAGPLRESPSRRVDATIVNIPVPDAQLHIERSRAAAGAVYGMRLAPRDWVTPQGQPVSRELLSGKRLHAVAGIGNPQRFFDSLRALGLDVRAHAFPDHHLYQAADLDFADCDWVLMTEKDAVKCRTFGRSDLVALRVSAEPDAAFEDFLLKALQGKNAHGLASA